MGEFRVARCLRDFCGSDHRDAVQLARLLRAGELAAIWMPDATHEAIRDLVRARQSATFDIRRARQHIQSYLLKYSPYVRNLESSRRRAVEVVQESAETMPRIDSSTRMFLDGQREDRPIADSLMIAFPMVMLRVLTQ